MVNYSKESERQNKVMQSILRDETPEKRIFFGYEGDGKLDKKEYEEAQREIEKKLEATKDARMPWFCPNCEKVMPKSLDNKMWRLYNHCFDCQVKIETKMRIDGSYMEWESKKVKKNIKAYLKDMEKSIKEWRKQKSPEFFNQVSADGHSLDKEKWTITNKTKDFIDKLADEALEEIYKMKEKL